MSERRPEDSERTWKIRPDEPNLAEVWNRDREWPGEQEGDRAAGRHAPAELDLGDPVGLEDLIRAPGEGGRRPHRLLRLPADGEELFGFRLRQSLGQGAFARVYLAEQPDLACRPVVLKVSAIEGTEHHTLARLQHTNIVPIFSVHEDERAGLRAVCMPYFGGAPLSRILEQLWSRTTRPTAGAQLVAALEEVGAPAPGGGIGDRAGGEGAGPVPPSRRPRPRRRSSSCAASATARRPPGSSPSSPRGSITPINAASSIAMSSRRTSCSAPRGSPSCSISTWPRRWPTAPPRRSSAGRWPTPPRSTSSPCGIAHRT